MGSTPQDEITLWDNQVRPQVENLFDRRQVEAGQPVQLSRTNGRGLDLFQQLTQVAGCEVRQIII